MKTKVFVSVWDAIEDSPQTAVSMKVRSAVMIELSEYIETLWVDSSAGCRCAWRYTTKNFRSYAGENQSFLARHALEYGERSRNVSSTENI